MTSNVESMANNQKKITRRNIILTSMILMILGSILIFVYLSRTDIFGDPVFSLDVFVAGCTLLLIGLIIFFGGTIYGYNINSNKDYGQ